MKHLYKTIVIGLFMFLAIPVLAQQGGNGNQGNGTIFIDNFFTTMSLGIPGGPICFATLTTIDDVNNWIRFNPDGSATIHWVGREAEVAFYAEGFADESDIWIGPGSTNLHYTLGETEQFTWHASGTVTHQITGETRDVMCQVAVNGDLKVFKLGFKNK